MAPLIRSAVLAQGRRQLARPARTPSAPSANPAPQTAPAAPARPDVAAEQGRREVERQLAAGRRELETEREAMRQSMAAEQAKALEQAARRGHDEGLMKGEAAGRAALEQEAERLRGLFSELSAARRDIAAQAEDGLIELAFAAVCRLVGTEAASRAAAVQAVNAAWAAQRGGDGLTVLLHPDDVAHVRERLGTLEHVNLVASPSVRVGGCMIDDAAGTLDARLDTQLAALRAALVRQRAQRREGGAAC